MTGGNQIVFLGDKGINDLPVLAVIHIEMIFRVSHDLDLLTALLYMYMIMKKKIIYSDAIKIMKSKRPCVRPNDGFDSQLRQKSYELYNKF